MNERIKELAEQAGITLPADTEYNGHIYRNALEKFANSIIAECQYILTASHISISHTFRQEVREHECRRA